MKKTTTTRCEFTIDAPTLRKLIRAHAEQLGVTGEVLKGESSFVGITAHHGASTMFAPYSTLAGVSTLSVVLEHVEEHD